MARTIAPTPVLKGKDVYRVLSKLQETDKSPKDIKESNRLKEIYSKIKEKGIIL